MIIDQLRIGIRQSKNATPPTTNIQKKIFHQMRVSRKRVEGCGALASNLQKREVNFSRMLCYIFVRWLDKGP